MPKAAVIYEKGQPDVFRYEDVEVDDPGPGEVRLKHTAIGVNSADTYHRSTVNHTYPLSEAAEAHRAIHERRTTGSTILLPFA